jgi:CHAT domain-containing protein
LIGIGLTELGRAEQALGYFDRALNLGASTPGLEHPLLTYTQKAKALSDASRVQEANALLESALAFARANQSYGYEADLLIQMAMLSLKANRRDAAIQQLEQAFDVATAGDARRLVSQAALELNKIYRLLGRLDEAEQALAKGIAATRKAGDRYTLPRYLAAYADIKMARRQYRQSNELYDEATDIVNGMLSNVSSANVKSSLIAVMNDIYLGHFLLVAQGFKSPEKAFTVIEDARGRSLADLLRLPPSARATLSAGTSQQNRQISTLQLQLQNAKSRAERKRILDDIFQAEESIRPIEAANSRKWRGMYTSPVAPKALRARLRPDEILVEYVLAELASYCLVVTGESLRLHELPKKAEISHSVDTLLAQIHQQKDTSTTATELYTFLFASVPEISTKRRIIVVPDGILTRLPFEVLLAPQGKSLLESHIVTYAPSGTVLALLRQNTSNDARTMAVLAVAAGSDSPAGTATTPVKVQRGIYDLEGANLPPLPAAEEEADAVAKILGGDSVILKGTAATEAAFKNQSLSRFRVIHFAVHGLVSTKYPERSALVFRPDPDAHEDGFLQAREIASLPIRAELVTLSACATGKGKINGEEGVASLVRPFLVAGARSVVANLWNADDDFTRTLMKEFYIQLASGTDIGASLKQAKLQMIQKYGAAATPQLWAGFIAVGETAQPVTH